MLPPAGENNVCEFLKHSTDRFGDVYMMQHFDVKYRKSEVFRDIDAFAGFVQKELGLKRGDVFTAFIPTTMEGIIAFYALNQIGVIGNFVHPLMSAEYLRETLENVNAKAVMILDILFLQNAKHAAEYVDVINRSGLPCIVCSPSYYAEGLKKFGSGIGSEITEKFILKLNNSIRYGDALAMGLKCDPLVNNCDDIAVYLNGGGTTGKSKTIKLTARAINEMTSRVSDLDDVRIPGEEAEVIVLPMFHCFGLCLGIHMAMCNSGRIIPMMQFDSRIFTKLMRKNFVVGFGGIPLMFDKLMRDKHFDGPWLKNIRLMFCGGDDVTDNFLDEFNEYFEKWGAEGRLRQGYGLTETCSVCCTNSNTDYRRGSVGRALRGVRMEIWDEDHHKLPDGQIGEFAISGPTIMSGYYTKDEADDFGLYTDEQGEKWVLSGDLGYRDEDGYYYFTGRKKRVILIAGYNIYPNDIEKTLSELDFIKESCAVQGWSGDRSMIRLFVSLKKDGDKEEYREIIRKTCADNFSKFHVPREIVFLDELPQTPLMKIDYLTLTQNKPGDKVYGT